MRFHQSRESASKGSQVIMTPHVSDGNFVSFVEANVLPVGCNVLRFLRPIEKHNRHITSSQITCPHFQKLIRMIARSVILIFQQHLGPLVTLFAQTILILGNKVGICDDIQDLLRNISQIIAQKKR